MWGTRFLKRVSASLSRSYLQTFSLGYHLLPEKAASIADGEEVSLADYAFYRHNGVGKGLCLLVLTSTRLVFATAFDSRGFPLQEHVNSTPVDEMAGVSFKHPPLHGRIADGRFAQGFLVRRQAGDELTFWVDDARRWFGLLTDRSSSRGGDT